MNLKVGDLVCYKHSTTGERYVGMITEIAANRYKNAVEWFNGGTSWEEYNFLIEMRQHYLDLRMSL